MGKGNVHSADDWKEVLTPVISQYQNRDLMRFLRAYAAFAISMLKEMLEAEAYIGTVRLKVNVLPQQAVSHLLRRPVGCLPNHV